MDTQHTTEAIRTGMKTHLHLMHNVNSLYLTKYATRYSKAISLEDSYGGAWILFSKLKNVKYFKQVKLPNHIVDYYNIKIINLLKNKGRHLTQLFPVDDAVFERYFSKVPEYYFEIHSHDGLPRSFRVLKCLKSLTLSFKELDSTDYSKIFSWRFWKWVESLTILKHLKVIVNFDKVTCDFLTQLGQAQPHFLVSLESFELDLSLKCWSQISPNVVSSFSNVFSYITDFRVTCDLSYFQTDFPKSTNSFTSVTQLTLNIYKPEIFNFKFYNFQALKNLHSLQSLDIRMTLDSPTYLIRFLKFITFPPSLTRIALELSSINWSHVIPNITNLDFGSYNPFENDQRCTEFYYKWSQLSVLQILEIKFPLIQKTSISNIHFIFPILKRLTSLSHLCYSCSSEETEETAKRLDFSLLLHRIAHLSPTLKLLIVADMNISLENFIPKNFSSFNLKTLSIHGSILWDKKIEGLVELLCGNDQNSVTAYKKVNIDKVIFEDEGTFLSFLRSIRKYQDKRNLDVHICVDVRRLSIDSVHTSLVNFIRQSGRLMNVSFYILKTPSPNMMMWELEILLDKYQTFRAVELEADFDFNPEPIDFKNIPIDI